MTDTTSWTYQIDSGVATLNVSVNGGTATATTLKGMCYSPCPLNGSNSSAPAIGDWFWDSYSGTGFNITGWEALWKRDLPNIQSLNVNSIRIYSMLSRQLETNGTYPNPWNSRHLFIHKSFLDRCWNNGHNPIYVLVGVPLPQAMFWLDNYGITPHNEIDFWTNVLQETVEQVGGHPAVLGFIIQNELDSAVVTYPNHGRTNLPSVDFWWSQAEKLGKIAKTAAPDKLIGMANHDDPSICGGAAEWMGQCPSLDFWGVNSYQPESFKTVFDETPQGPGYQGLTGPAQKPVIVTEWGMPATSHHNPHDHSTIYADTTTEDKTVTVLTEMIPQAFGTAPSNGLPAYDIGLNLGLYYFEFCDEWWNQGGLPNIYTWWGGPAAPGFPNGYWDQDGFGLYSIKRGGTLANDEHIWTQDGGTGGPTTPIDVHTARVPTVTAVENAFQTTSAMAIILTEVDPEIRTGG